MLATPPPMNHLHGGEDFKSSPTSRSDAFKRLRLAIASRTSPMTTIPPRLPSPTSNLIPARTQSPTEDTSDISSFTSFRDSLLSDSRSVDADSEISDSEETVLYPRHASPAPTKSTDPLRLVNKPFLNPIITARPNPAVRPLSPSLNSPALSYLFPNHYRRKPKLSRRDSRSTINVSPANSVMTSLMYSSPSTPTQLTNTTPRPTGYRTVNAGVGYPFVGLSPTLFSLRYATQKFNSMLLAAVDPILRKSMENPKSDLVETVIELSTVVASSWEILASFKEVLKSVNINLTYVRNPTSGYVTAIFVSYQRRGRISLVDPVSEQLVVSSTAQLRELLRTSPSPHEAFVNSSAEMVQCVLELIQLEIPQSSCLDSRYRRDCLTCLRRLAFDHGVVPPSFLINELSRDGKYPISGNRTMDVWRGRWRDTTLCIKVCRLYGTHTRRKDVIKAFCSETVVWKQLSHPNVLPFLGVSESEFYPSYCLLSPWQRNGNILNYLSNNPQADRRKAVTEVASGLRYLHDFVCPVVHGNIRGANILVTDTGMACLADYGISSILESDGMTMDSSAMSAIRWTAPERFSTTQPASPQPNTAGDIYAFGCTILEIFTGKAPFYEVTSDPTLLWLVSEGRRPTRPEDVGMTDELWNLITDCWQQDAQTRPSARLVSKRLAIAQNQGQRSPDVEESGWAMV